MIDSNSGPVVLDERSCPPALCDPSGAVSEELHPARSVGRRIRLQQRAYHVALRNIRRTNFAAASTLLGASSASVDLWYVDLDVTADALSCFRKWLSLDELARAERFHSDLHQSRYIAGRATLRCLLAERLGCSPTDILFSYGKNRKPMIEGGRANIEFNLAHSGGDAVIALADGAAVGVDIELLRPIADVESLAHLVFSDVERGELELAPDPVLAFLNGWTRKEAYVKALGLGLTAPLREITVSLSDRAQLFSTGLPDQAVSNWRILNAPHPRAVVAIALGPRLDSAGMTRGGTTKSTQESSSSRRVNS